MASIYFTDIMQTCSAEAIASKLQITESSEWRRICRQYSEKFHTPLHLVLEMDAEFVLLHVYESNLESMDVEENIHNLMDRIYTLENPDHEIGKEQELQDFIKRAEEEEEERLQAGLPVFKGKNQESSISVPETEEEPLKNLPTEGYLNLSYLESQDQEE